VAVAGGRGRHPWSRHSGTCSLPVSLKLPLPLPLDLTLSLSLL
jgi:hypothetical protein